MVVMGFLMKMAVIFPNFTREIAFKIVNNAYNYKKI